VRYLCIRTAVQAAEGTRGGERERERAYRPTWIIAHECRSSEACVPAHAETHRFVPLLKVVELIKYARSGRRTRRLSPILLSISRLRELRSPCRPCACREAIDATEIARDSSGVIIVFDYRFRLSLARRTAPSELSRNACRALKTRDSFQPRTRRPIAVRPDPRNLDRLKIGQYRFIDRSIAGKERSKRRTPSRLLTAR